MNIAQQFIKQRDTQVDDGVIPLINVVFLMLIFFMVAGNIQKGDLINILPPESINESKENIEANATIILSKNGQLYLNDQIVVNDQVGQLLLDLFEQTEDKEGFWVKIKADGDVSIAQMRPLFSQIKQSGLSKVSIATSLYAGK